MEFLPNIGIMNPFDTIGDCVLMEPIARQLGEALGVEVFVISSSPELFIGHPTVRSLGADVPPGMRIINMEDAIRSLEKVPKGKSAVVPGKVRRMYEAAGLSERDIIAPKLYLTEQEIEQAELLDGAFADKRIGIALGSKHSFKNLPYTKYLIKQLAKRGWQVFAFGQSQNGKYAYLDKLPVVKVLDKPIRKVMMYIALMDVFAGPDTGLLHIAGALEVPFVVATREIWRDLYECYDIGTILAARQFGKYSLSTWRVTPKRFLEAVERHSDEHFSPAIAKTAGRQRSEIAIFRLDGLGGTLTVADQAKKIHEATGVKPDLIIRGYATLFAKNPHVNNVIEVGHVKWGECLDEMLELYDTIAEIRFAPAKWHQKGKQWFEQDFTAAQGLFDDFPMHYNQLEVHGKHQVQLTDWYLGLPEDTIDMELFDVKAFGGLPDSYMVINNGVDVIHKGMRQTKVWSRWDELVKLVSIPTVQTGTANDPLVPGVIDLRGQYELNQLPYIIQKATVGAFTEGGLMHLSYATKHPNIFILRGPTRGKLFEYPGHHMIDSYICYNCWYSTEDWFENCPREIDAICMKSITPERVAMQVEEAIA